MAEINDISKGKQIRNLCLVMASGIIAALAVFLMMLHYYGPSGSYVAKNVLLSPESAKSLRYGEVNAKIGKTTSFVFDLIEFTYYDEMNKKMNRVDLDMEKYAKFYDMIGNDKSLVVGDEHAEDALKKSNFATLAFKIRPEGDRANSSTSQILNEIHFSEDDYYRISLRGQNAIEGWADFYHPGIYHYVLEQFTLKR